MQSRRSAREPDLLVSGQERATTLYGTFRLSEAALAGASTRSETVRTAEDVSWWPTLAAAAN